MGGSRGRRPLLLISSLPAIPDEKSKNAKCVKTFYIFVGRTIGGATVTIAHFGLCPSWANTDDNTPGMITMVVRIARLGREGGGRGKR